MSRRRRTDPDRLEWHELQSARRDQRVDVIVVVCAVCGSDDPLLTCQRHYDAGPYGEDVSDPYWQWKPANRAEQVGEKWRLSCRCGARPQVRADKVMQALRHGLPKMPVR